MNIETLVKELTEASNFYYNTGETTMSDEEFDIKVEKLRNLDPTNAFLQTVGARPVGKTFPHSKPIGSQEKLKDRSKFESWIQTILMISNTKKNANSHFKLVGQHKMDGCTVVLYYTNGKLIRALTRGDGIDGVDITDNVLMMKNVKPVLPNKFTGMLRGEGMLHKSDFNKYFASEGYVTARNTVSGIAGDQKHSPLNNHLKIYYYDMEHSQINNLQTEYERLSYIKDSLGLEIIPNEVGNTVEELWALYQKWEIERESLDYDIDGMIIRANLIEVQEELGMSSDFRPKGQKCLKFPPAGGTTILKGFKLSVGHTGAIYPNGILDPIKIGGVTITNVLLNNFEMIETLGIAVGDKVRVIRAGDVIPKVIGLVEKGQNRTLIPVPTYCPKCNSFLVKDGVHIYCMNEDCEAKEFKRLKTYVEKREIKYLGKELLAELYNNHDIRQPHHLYKMTFEWLSTKSRGIGIVGSGAKRILAEIEKSKDCSLKDFIGSLGIAMMGRRQAEMIINQGIDTVDKFFNLQEEQLITFDGFSSEGGKAKIIVDSLRKTYPLMKELLKCINLKEKQEPKQEKNTMNGKLSGKSFCFTGAIEKEDLNGNRFTRKMIWEVVKENGGNVSEDVNGTVNYLVQADPSSQSSKTKKAEKLGVEIISEVDFWKMV